MSESSLCKVTATVMIYNEQERQWFHAGSNTSLPTLFSEVHILYNELRLSYRIVGMKLDDSADVTVNMNIMKKLKDLRRAQFF